VLLGRDGAGVATGVAAGWASILRTVRQKPFTVFAQRVSLGCATCEWGTLRLALYQGTGFSRATTHR